MATRDVQSTSIKFGFPAGKAKDGQEAVSYKSITRINPKASDEDVLAVARELSPLYQTKPEYTYRVDTAVLQAA